MANAVRFLLPCPFKYITGYDCPGCGFQRSFVALLKGNLKESMHLYAPTVPILITVALCILLNFWMGAKSKRPIQVLFTITAAIILVSYSFKIFMPHVHI